MSFSAQMAADYDRWYRRPEGQYADALERELFLRLIRPQRGQRLLEVGCGTGHNLEFFRDLGLEITGVDASDAMLEIAAKKLQPEIRLSKWSAEELPFDDSSFDIVVLITALEFVSDPSKALQEAARVGRGKLYLGVLNKASFTGIYRRIKSIFQESIYNKARFYTIWEMEGMVNRALGKAPLTWESILFFPSPFFCVASDLVAIFGRPFAYSFPPSSRSPPWDACIA